MSFEIWYSIRLILDGDATDDGWFLTVLEIMKELWLSRPFPYVWCGVFGEKGKNEHLRERRHTRYFEEFLLKDSSQMDQGHESGFPNKIFGLLDMLKFCA